MKLSDIRKGHVVTITSIPDDSIRAQAYRFGIDIGETVTCLEKLRRGPVVIEKNFQEIALGRYVADHISVISENGRTEGPNTVTNHKAVHSFKDEEYTV